MTFRDQNIISVNVSDGRIRFKSSFVEGSTIIRMIVIKSSITEKTKIILLYIDDRTIFLIVMIMISFTTVVILDGIRYFFTLWIRKKDVQHSDRWNFIYKFSDITYIRIFFMSIS